MPLTKGQLGSTVRPVGFDLVLLEHMLEKQGVRVFLPLQLLQAAILYLALQGGLSLTGQLKTGKLICNFREAGTWRCWQHQGTGHLTSRCCTNNPFN